MATERTFVWISRIATLLCVAGQLLAQSISGTISGRIVDASGLAIAGAPVTLVNERMGESRKAETNETGAFTFAAVLPGVYTVRVEQQGFQTFERTGTNLSANERLSLGTIELKIGTVTEKISVAATGAVVQTTSSENSALLTSTQISMTQVRGRDVMSLLRLLPGVAYTVTADGKDSEAVGEQFGSDFPGSVQGGRITFNTFSVDGLAGNDLGNPQTGSSSVNLDAIGEVKVQLSGYPAEYGRNPGALVSLVTKSGTRDYHGGAYWYKRHEMFNANNFFNNRNNVRKPLYRYTTLGFTLGGPVYIPKTFNQGKDKLFFFYSLENWGEWAPQSLKQTTMPTQLERQGNFSQTLDLNGQMIVVNDPLSNHQPFSGNIIPASRINSNGQILLNVFSLPNALNRSVTKGAYNYNFSTSYKTPKRNHVFKIDYQPTDNDRIWVRGSTWRADNEGYGVGAGSVSTWDLLSSHYLYTDNGIVVNYTRIISPSTVNEFSAGLRHGFEDGPPSSQAGVDRLVRSKLGYTLGQFYPQNNPLNMIPTASFGGVPSAAAISWDGRFPMQSFDLVMTLNDGFTHTQGAHLLKFGVFADRGRENEGASGTFAGNFAFGRDVNNPFDSNYAYSNALLGNFSSYLESTSRPPSDAHTLTLQWYAQDTWKVTRKLTLDYGLRFVWYTPWAPRLGRASAFALDRYDPSNAPTLFRPTRNASGQRVGVDPVTGELVPGVMIGAYVPGTGDAINGMVVGSDKTYPTGFSKQPPVLLEPRFGFAYDPFGDGKTAIRGSAGIFHQTRFPGGVMVGLARSNPPRQFNPTVYYGNMDSFLDSSGVLFPSSVTALDKNALTPSVYSYTFGIQRDVGFGTVVDVSYVGSVMRHLWRSRNLNVVPYFSQFLPQNEDPTNPGRPLPDNYFRPLPGYGSITYYETASTANYNALQVSVNRRYAHGLQMGLAYTWSKAMGYDTNNTDYDTVATYRPIRIWNYGKSPYDQTHKFLVNYLWDVPKASKLWDNPAIRLVFDNWQIGGVTAFVSGVPSGVGYSTTDGMNITGGGDGSRITVTGKAALPHGERSFGRWFDTSVFARTPQFSFGNAPKDVFRLPGINNWDMELFKNIPLKSEARFLQLRWETYNTFNHAQWLGVDNAARFDPQGKQVNARFGQVISARPARAMQVSARLTF